MTHTKHGVILCNMGGPESLDDVRPFLYNLFSDREIIRLGPPFMQKVLALLIAYRRAPKSRNLYRQIGDSSPLRQLTNRQALALERELCRSGEFRVRVAMRYWPPLAKDAINELLAEGITSLIALTLYPHYSRATTGSSLRHLQAAAADLAPAIPLRLIDSWPTQPQYVNALADNIAKGLAALDGERTALIYSAHSLPVSFIEEGDPYVTHLEQTITAVEQLTRVPGRLCYQSRSGPVEWLSPSTPELIEELARQGYKAILVVPISFVSDHVETLHEIDIEYRQFARNLGVRLERSDSLNDHPVFIAGLRTLVENSLAS